MRNPFPPWTNHIRILLGGAVVGGLVYAILIVNYGFSPYGLATGYMPEQPVPYSHKLHAGKLGIDCRYCHNTVERNAHAAIPATQVCMNCHTNIHPESVKLAPVRESYATGKPIPWARIHDLPDYAYFNHAAHVQKGVSCKACHGRIDKMEEVWREHPLSMGWCLNCHRNPEPHLVPKHLVTKMDYEQPSPETGAQLKKMNNVKPREDCATCHR